MSIQDLLEEANPRPPLTGFDADLEAAMNREMETIDVEVVFGKSIALMTLTEINGGEWSHIACWLPRPGNTQDAKLGCNTDEVLARYPVDRIVINGEHPTPDQWEQVLKVMTAADREDVVAALWWIHVGAPEEEKAALIALSERKKRRG
ncbi:hypothetical protein [uncultured Microbacterium sp.]|uniref:hypothetical protein n=1 Tax=uncultured Microbacterium sp. TaxID=191216 RepID=UPI0025D2C6C0|nr:hypothetical protein [uncultured Microbacterium sp.]